MAGGTRRRAKSVRTDAWRWPVVVAFAAGLGYAYTIDRLPVQALFVYAGASVLAAVMYAFDKSAAVTQRSRTPENMLHLVSLLGGWPGALLAQGQFRHKTSKREFQVGFWVTVGLNCLALGWVMVGGLRGLL